LEKKCKDDRLYLTKKRVTNHTAANLLLASVTPEKVHPAPCVLKTGKRKSQRTSNYEGKDVKMLKRLSKSNHYNHPGMFYDLYQYFKIL